MSSHHYQPKANKTDAGNGSKAICRVSNVLRSPSPDPRRSPIMKLLIVTLTLLSSALASAGEAKMTLHLLDHTSKKNTETRFWIDWSKNWRGIVSSKVVPKETADEIIMLLRKSLLNTEAMHFCGHDPIYGIEAIDTDGKILKTSLCFSCLTWVKPGLRLDIAGERGANNVLCKKLREVIELPDELLKAEPSITKPKGEQDASGNRR